MTVEIRPQPGPQETFLSSPADIAIYGGAAGGGKTWALLMEPLRHMAVKGFGAVIFRREATQITNQGGLWDAAGKLYPEIGGRPKVSPKLMYQFPSGARVTFGHLNAEAEVQSWQGSEIALICFDELTHFSRAQFFYMLSRNRSDCGVRPYVRATTNPDSESWVADFIAWWIDQETGLPIPERAGVLRWFARVDDEVVWADSPAELAARYGVQQADAKSVTFIPANVTDNQILLKKNPEYLANLKALARVEQARLLGGNWKVRAAAGAYFRRGEVLILPVAPRDIVATTRAWDLAATLPTDATPDPDWTAGPKIGLRSNGRYVVLDVRRDRLRADDVRTLIRQTAEIDGRGVRIKLPQDPGQAGKAQAESMVRMLAGFAVQASPVVGDKVTRAEPFAAQWQAGNVDIVAGHWNEAFLAELEAFPDGKHDDQVDAAADAFASLTFGNTGPLVGTMNAS
jgi:predicted phage terminase large subunit-like protein